MTEPAQEGPLWRLTFTTVAGTRNAVTLCAVHRLRYNGALAFLGLPAADAVPAPAGRRRKCRNCQHAARGVDA